jgi:hypothetical protein
MPWSFARPYRNDNLLQDTSMYRPLTSLPHPNNAQAHKEGNRAGYLERLSAFLIDSKRRSNDVGFDAFRTSAHLTFI